MSASIHSARTITPRRPLVAVAGALLASGALLSVSACGAGQISQTANQVAAINGANQTYIDQQKSLSDVHVLFPVTAGQAKLAFVLSNQNAHEADNLVSITDQNGRTATISGDTELAAGGNLYGAPPAGSDGAAGITRLRVTLPVDSSWRPGLTNELTFKLEKAGNLKIPVPLDAGAHPASAMGVTPGAEAEHDEGGGGH